MAQLKSGSTVGGKAIATEEYVQQNAPTPHPIMVTATLSTTWAGSGPYTQSVTVLGVTSTNNITISLALS